MTIERSTLEASRPGSPVGGKQENPWDSLESIWDGWEYQCFGRLHKAWSTYENKIVTLNCAVGYIAAHYEVSEFLQLPPDVYRRFQQVDDEIRRRERTRQPHPALGMAIAHANDAWWLTPAQFRELDRKLEFEYQQQQLQKRMDAIDVESELVENSSECISAGA